MVYTPLLRGSRKNHIIGGACETLAYRKNYARKALQDAYGQASKKKPIKQTKLLKCTFFLRCGITFYTTVKISCVFATNVSFIASLIHSVNLAERPAAVFYTVFFTAIFAYFYKSFVFEKNGVPKPSFVRNHALREECAVAFFALQDDFAPVFDCEFLNHDLKLRNSL